jgi:hypothetical protein
MKKLRGIEYILAMSTKTDNPSEYLLEQARTTGVACATTKDGHVIVFKKEQLEALLARINNSGHDIGVIFVKRQDFQNVS